MSTHPPYELEYLSGKQLGDVGRELGISARVECDVFTGTDIRARQLKNKHDIEAVYRSLLTAAEKREILTPAAEWLLDNYFLIEETIQQARRDLPPRFYRQLPTIETNKGIKVPRMTALAFLYLRHSHSEVTATRVTSAIEGYQSSVPCRIGELWAVPSLLRFLLIEELRTLAVQIQKRRLSRASANHIADQVLLEQSSDLRLSLLQRETPNDIDYSFASQLIYRLRDASVQAHECSIWLEERLEEQGSDSEEVLIAEQSRLSAGAVRIGNIIRSLRTINDIDWTEWFKTVSKVDEMLQSCDGFDQLDFTSQDQYRNAIETIARQSGLDELTVIEKAIDSSVGPHALKTQDYVGYYLIGDGRAGFERLVGAQPSISNRILRTWVAFGWKAIAIPIGLLTLLALIAAYLFVLSAGLPVWQALLLGFLATLPATEGATGLFNFLVTHMKAPARLIGYEYADGVPQESRTLVVMPCMISSRDAIDDLVRNLEVHYLASTRGELYYALVSDWVDADVPVNDHDKELLAYAQAEIARLAERYAHTGSTRFYLLHRNRTFNESQGTWMGWERKRGKLIELNRVLRGRSDTSFVETDLPDHIRFVMTLDADTRLTRDSVTRLVGKLAHPMNSPQIDPISNSVVQGHAILQPRVMPSLTTGDEASVFQHTFSQNRGLDPYVFTVSDVYQDLTANGSFTGKGLYDVDAVIAVLDERFDDNTILSHDLLEGTVGRSALVTDVELVEDFPVKYEVEASRQHRWARGDWQLLPLILGADAGISSLGRWKMLDNLRRSLVPIAWVLASLLGWTLLSLHDSVIWQLALFLSLFIAPTLSVVEGIFPAGDERVLRVHISSVITEIGSATSQVLLRIVFIAHSAVSMADAIGRTLYRLFVSRQNLLEWRTAAQAHAGANWGISDYYRVMPGAVLIGGIGFLLAMAAGNDTLLVAAPLCALWVASPLLAWKVSQSAETQDRLEVSVEERRQFRTIARRTWHYFETFVTPEHNSLPPDNFQEHPEPVVANRTSPTNIGLYLLSVISARDFGWIAIQDTVQRIEDTLATVEALDKHRGHLFNWYDTKTCKVLQPPYVSAVDSGNLAGHLITLSATCRDWAEAPYAYLQAGYEGIADCISIVAEELAAVPDDRRSLRPLRRRLEERINGFQRTTDALIREPEFAAVTTSYLLTMAEDIEKLAREIDLETGSQRTGALIEWAHAVTQNCRATLEDTRLEQAAVEVLRSRLEFLRDRARTLAFNMDFAFLLRPERRLLAIGYRPDTDELDQSCYDLLASEARLTSLFGIAKGDLPTEHWFRLGRPIVPVGNLGALVSWSGSMFEYLMPPLVMQEQPGGILSQSNAQAIKRQIEYGRQCKVPWGISESAFNARDQEMTYQYANFGVPTLGMKRGLAENLVIAPYATMLAAQYQPRAAIVNLDRLTKMGALGRYGFHDAIDFTHSRLPENTRFAIVRNYMAHHHGMSILAISNVVFQGRLRTRFHSDPVIEAAELLLQENAPRNVPVSSVNQHEADLISGRNEPLGPVHRTITDPVASERAVSLLSNGHYSLMMTATGSGHASWNGLSVNRWTADVNEAHQGQFLFVRDQKSGEWWSATAEPRRANGEVCEAVFSDSRAEFHKRVGSLRTLVEVIVASETDAQGHRITLFNDGDKERFLDVTSYSEPVLSLASADKAHPAFSKLFVRTTVSADKSVIRAVRNRRRHDEPDMEVAHLVVSSQRNKSNTEAETDRRRFIGRGRRLDIAAAFDKDAVFTAGSEFTLDPVFALRRTIRIPAGKQTSMIFWTLAAPSGAQLETGIARLQHPECFEREAMHAWTRSQVQLRYVGMSPEEAIVFQTLASHLIFSQSILGPDASDHALSQQSTLWSLGISGDYPILILRIDAETDIEIVRKSLRAQEYFRARGFLTDLVVVNERLSSYTQDLQLAIEALCENARLRGSSGDGANHIFALRRDLIPDTLHKSLMATARVIFQARNGKFTTQIERAKRVWRVRGRRSRSRPLVPQVLHASRREDVAVPPDAGSQLQYWNGYGGFDEARREYVINLPAGHATPHPWINVLSNDNFGAHVSAEGTGYTWSSNSRDYQLTPWSNDPVVDRPGETWLIVDLDTGAVCSPMPALCGSGQDQFEIRHGLGYSRFSSKTQTLSLSLLQTVHVTDPVKLTRLALCNSGSRKRSLRIYHYVEWVLGNDRARTASTINARLSSSDEVMLASNPYSNDYAAHTAFVACDRPLSSWTCHRQSALGDGTVWLPQPMLTGDLLSDATGVYTRDPCAALSVDVTLEAGEEQQLTFMLGDASSEYQALHLVHKHRQHSFDDSLEAVRQRWHGLTDVLQVQTPDKAMDLLVNTWLPYQSVGCRLQARAAFYQASGAYGFRDQLQDTMAFLLHEPSLARRQILNAASRQFYQGDVQHWWLPGSGVGVRTLISDDVVWLAYGVAHYVSVTGDSAILDEELSFLEGPELEPGEHDRMFLPDTSQEKSALYEHCVCALALAMKRTGVHGLPLMLGGDWNDGMNRVGEQGRGESVWLGWFLASTLSRFIPLAEQRGDTSRVALWQAHLDALLVALESDAWEQDHYLRAWYDDGTALGSSASVECRIDSIAQSWSVMSGLAGPTRAAKAMNSVLERLVDNKTDTIRLFVPPFANTDKEPGYIKGYPPGVRENGGQYTHAATWVVIALAQLGRGDDAYTCWQRLNPVMHATDKESADIYRVEPYVVAADVYAGEGRAGRGGWTWYTGSASWLYRAAVESILGITRRGSVLYVVPVLPSSWPGYEATLRLGTQVLNIKVEQQAGNTTVSINDTVLDVERGWPLD
ncbi:GH36-type glycosyl hydrolase domain-containing protein [Granulosicoccus antarcticus]|nr:glucoamylase family protein [Granulosicoccus antarcticus]